MKTALVVLADGFETLEALTPVDVLRRAGVQVTTAGLKAREVVSAQKVPVQADTVLAENLPAADVIILPGGLPGSTNLGASAMLEKMVKAQLQRGGMVAAICAAPAKTLAKWGILSGRRATCYPGCECEFPADAHYCTEKVVVDGTIITSQGPATAFPFAYKLVELLLDAPTANNLQGQMLYGK